MASYVLSSSEIFDIQANKVAFDDWNTNDSEFDYSFAKKCVFTAINEVLTEKQRLYFTMYHINGMKISDIAELEGVNKGTVSRTLMRASKRLYSVLRWSNPVFMNAPASTRNKRIIYG